MWTIQGSVMISVIYTGKHSWETFPIKISSNLLQAVKELQGHLFPSVCIPNTCSMEGQFVLRVPLANQYFIVSL